MVAGRKRSSLFDVFVVDEAKKFANVATRSIGQNPTEDEILELVMESDLNGDGTIDFQEPRPLNFFLFRRCSKLKRSWQTFKMYATLNTTWSIPDIHLKSLLTCHFLE